MNTPYLDEEIERLESFKDPIHEHVEQLKEFKVIKEALSIHGVSKCLSIKLEDWHHQCGDGCCDMYGTEITLNGNKCDNKYAGDDVRTALKFVLNGLGYEADIDVC